MDVRIINSYIRTVRFVTTYFQPFFSFFFFQRRFGFNSTHDSEAQLSRSSTSFTKLLLLTIVFTARTWKEKESTRTESWRGLHAFNSVNPFERHPRDRLRIVASQVAWQSFLISIHEEMILSSKWLRVYMRRRKGDSSISFRLIYR